MRHINKSAQEPDALLRCRKSSWESLSKDEKDEIRTRLLKDQRDLCCYCMCRISAGSMKVEHYRSQTRHPDDALAWRNLLAACSGNEGAPPSQQTCDTRKQDNSLTVDPLREATVRDLRYLADGSIRSETKEIHNDLEQHLNLNVARLRQNRVAAWDALVTALKRRHGRSERWGKGQLESELHRLREMDPYIAYFGALEYWLMKLIRKRS